MRKILLGLLGLISFITAQCSHIVGGELYYDCTGGNVYHVTLKLYRNCSAQCNSCAPYSNPDYLTIFDANGNIFSQPAITYNTVNQLNATFSTSCPVSPPDPADYCIEEADYTCDVVLPPATGGYTIVYQRCCRNNSISNLVTGQGATYTAQVPGSAFATCNNSARFNTLPPLYICESAPLSLNFSASDPDGDSLVYSLCDPYVGASSNCPDPVPNNGQANCPTAASTPPYAACQYVSPYSSSDFTNSPSSATNVTIDPQSGIVSGTPNQQGVYDITVCVSEYRNGQLLNTLRRDFQFTVIACDIPVVTVPSVGITNGVGVYIKECDSLTVNFTSIATNPTNGQLTYLWNFGVPGSTTDTSSQAYPSFTYPDTGTYLAYVVVSVPSQSGGGICTDTAYAYVEVYPKLTSSFTAPSECFDSTIQFTQQTVSTAGAVTSWFWSFGDGNYSLQQNPAHMYAAAGSYNVSLITKNVKGCKDTATGTVTVYPLPANSFTADSSFCAGASEVFTNNSTGAAAYLWNFGRSATDTSSLTNPVEVYNTAGSYNVTLVDVSSHGCKDTSTETVIVHPLPVVTTSGNKKICPYDSTQLNATGGGTYLWTPATGLSDSAIANPVATPPPPNTSTYTVAVTSPFNCVTTASLQISFFLPPHANAGTDTSVCLNPVSFHDSTQLDATGGVSYQWSPGASLSNPNIANPWARPSTNTTYTVTATDANGCTASDSVIVYVLDPALNLILQNSVSICQGDTAHATILNQGATGYSWNPSLFLTNPTSWNTGFYPNDTTNFILTVTNWCYVKSDSVLIIVDPKPNLGIPAVDSTCTGKPYQFNAQNATTYQWAANPTLSSTTIPNPVATPFISTRYILAGTNQYGCISTDTSLILVYQPSTIEIYPKDTPFICQGSTAPLRAYGAYSYMWTPAASLSNPNTAFPVASPTDTTQYTVVATNIHGCTTTDSLLIKVQKPVTAYAQTPFVACAGIPVHLQAYGGPFYSWSPSAGLNDTTTNNPFALPDSTTTYTVKVFNDCFGSTATVVVDIRPLPTVNAGNDTTIWRDTYAELHGVTSADSFFWYPSTWLENAASLNTTASPQQNTWYYLIAYDQYGCENKDSVEIFVTGHTELVLPTGFSPNGDGMNDEFKVLRTLNIEKINLFAVFDRWGEVVFSTDNINTGWDGTRNGKPCPLGVYAWTISATSKDGEEISKKGNVTLIR